MSHSNKLNFNCPLCYLCRKVMSDVQNNETKHYKSMRSLFNNPKLNHVQYSFTVKCSATYFFDSW